MVPLQVGFPGAMELAVIFLIAVIVFGVPLALVAGGLYFYRNSRSDRSTGEEIAALRQEVRQLREEIDRLDDEE